jgi:hypothetical protein
VLHAMAVRRWATLFFPNRPGRKEGAVQGGAPGMEPFMHAVIHVV